MKIAIGPGEVAGYFSRLKSGFEKEGVVCTHYSLTSHPFDYDKGSHLFKDLYLAIQNLTKINTLFKYLFSVFLIKIRIFLFIYTLLNYDVFIFSGSSSFLNFLELPILKLFKKKVIVIFMGSDARHPLLSGVELDDNGGFDQPIKIFKKTKKMARKIRWIEYFSTHIINHTATAQLFKKNFIKYASIGMPIDVDNPDQKSNYLYERDFLKIVHAPSRPIAKGTKIFRQIIQDIRAKGVQVEYVELVGQSNSIVLEQIATCDLVFDEIYGDMPMAMFATEAAMYGKPALVGGYYANQYQFDNQNEQYPPVLCVLPEDITNHVNLLIYNDKYRLDLGMRARKFVEETWSSNRVASNYLKLICNTFPGHWVANPKELNYVMGWGLSKEQWVVRVKKYIDDLGIQALCLNDRPDLLEEIDSKIKEVKYD